MNEDSKQTELERVYDVLGLKDTDRCPEGVEGYKLVQRNAIRLQKERADKLEALMQLPQWRTLFTKSGRFGIMHSAPRTLLCFVPASSPIFDSKTIAEVWAPDDARQVLHDGHQPALEQNQREVRELFADIITNVFNWLQEHRS